VGSPLEQYGLVTVTPAAISLLDLATVKNHLRIDPTVTNDDAELTQHLIPAATEAVERLTDRRLLTQTVKLTLDAFPSAYPFWNAIIPSADMFGALVDGEIRLPVAPVQSVASITYTDLGGVVQTLDPANYQVDVVSLPARIWPKYASYWPATRFQPAAIAITFLAGWTSAALVPAALRYAALMLARSYFDGETAVGDVSDSVMRLIDQQWTGLNHGSA
jgi:hypothetical protein